jgi:hypothetical protein
VTLVALRIGAELTAPDGTKPGAPPPKRFAAMAP